MVVTLPLVVQKNDADPSTSGADSLRHPLPHVTILMCTFNGERFLGEQLESIARQTHPDWSVVISDDGSTDSTLDILNRYREAWGPDRLLISSGPKRGFAANFLSVTCNTKHDSQFYAWADQDDIWRDNKLEIALEALQRQPAGIPLLYSGRTEHIDESGTRTGLSPVFDRSPGFGNALVQSIGGGNTMVFNQMAHELFVLAGPEVDVVAHDWWAYLLVTGAGGRAYHDMTPTILYRQHDANLIGSNSGTRARLTRLSMMFKGRFRGWNERNIAALESVQASLSPENQVKLELFKAARKSQVVSRLRFLHRCGVYRQTVWGNLGLILAAVFNKL